MIEEVKKDISKKLSVFKDPNFVFEEGAHTYHYKDIKYDSVTSFIKRFKVPFDREYWSKRKADERGVDVSVILEEWQGKSDVANDLGTKVHKWIEDFWTGSPKDLTSEDDEKLIERIDKFMDLYEKIFLIRISAELNF